eukprot:3373576-Prorocentrum_lima.AAC.1
MRHPPMTADGRSDWLPAPQTGPLRRRSPPTYPPSTQRRPSHGRHSCTTAPGGRGPRPLEQVGPE